MRFKLDGVEYEATGTLRGSDLRKLIGGGKDIFLAASEGSDIIVPDGALLAVAEGAEFYSVPSAPPISEERERRP